MLPQQDSMHHKQHVHSAKDHTGRCWYL